MRIKGKFTLVELFYCVLFLTLLTDLLGNYTYFGEFTILKYLKNINQLIFIRLFSLFIVTKNYKNQDLLKSALLIILAEISRHFSGSNNLLTLFYLLAAGKKLDIKKIIRIVFISNSIVFIVVAFSSVLGLTSNNDIISETGRIRYSLGFTHPNTTSIVLSQVVFSSWCLNENKFKNLLIATFGLIICYFVCYSRTASMILLSLLLFEILLYLLAKIKGIIKKQFWNLVYLLGGFSFIFIIISFAVASNMINLNNYNSILSGRIKMMQNYFNYYNLTLFGQRIKTGQSVYSLGMSTLDNSYLFLLLSYGVVIFALYFILFLMSTRNLIKKKENEKLLVFILYAFYGMFETVAVRFIFNFSLCFFIYIIWNKKEYD